MFLVSSVCQLRFVYQRTKTTWIKILKIWHTCTGMSTDHKSQTSAIFECQYGMMWESDLSEGTPQTKASFALYWIALSGTAVQITVKRPSFCTWNCFSGTLFKPFLTWDAILKMMCLISDRFFCRKIHVKSSTYTVWCNDLNLCLHEIISSTCKWGLSVAWHLLQLWFVIKGESLSWLQYNRG